MSKLRKVTVGDLLSDMTKRIRYGRNYRDSFFCGLFGSDKQALLELYNALNGSDYDNPDDIEVVTIENAIYITTKNDVAYLLNGTINLYEHQSTHNPNMPVRFLIYLAQEYQKYVGKQSRSEYGGQIITLPTPKCVVFYNGEAEENEQYEIRLSEAFANKEVEADAELVVHVYNVNAGHNEDLMNKCKTLYGYSILMDKITRYKNTMSLKASIETAIEECIDENILRGYLMKHRNEVLGSLLTDFDKKKYERTIYEDGVLAGTEKGIAIGTEQKSSEDIDKLIRYLMSEDPTLSKADALDKAKNILCTAEPV